MTRVWRNAVAMAAIRADRLANANRLGETCKTLVCEEVVGVLDEVDEPLWHEQWPNDIDVPSEAHAGAPDDTGLASFAGWTMQSGPTFLRLRLEAEAEERAVAARAQLAAEAVVRDREALRVMVAEAEVREATALRAVEAENVRLAEEARRKIEDEAAALADAERARISARSADLPRRAKLSDTLSRDFVNEHFAWLKEDDYAPDRYVDAAIEKLSKALFEGEISGCEYPLKTDEAERDVMMRGIVNDAITFERHLVAKELENDFASGLKSPPVGLRIDVTRVLADFRVNLTVRAEDYEMAVTSGALFDEINGVLFVPPRFDLKPLEKWLPFDLSRLQREGGDGFVKVDDDCGIITWQPSIPKAAGPTKSDGSPNMSFAENIRVAEMIKPVTPGGRGGSGSASKVASKARTQGTGTPPRRAAASPPRVAPGDGVFVAAQLRAAAVPYANYFAWFLVVVALGLFHKNIEAVLSVGFVLVAHSVLSVVGGHGGVSDMNVSLFEMATPLRPMSWSRRSRATPSRGG